MGEDERPIFGDKLNNSDISPNEQTAHPEKKEPVSFRLLSISELLADKQMLDSFLSCYVKVFSETGEGEWGENLTVEKARERLDAQIGRTSSDTLKINLMINGHNEIVGFCLGALAKSLSGYQDYPGDALNKSEEVEEVNKKISTEFPEAAEDPILSVMELGVTRESRSGLGRVIKLVAPILNYGEKNQARVLLFWTSKNSKLYALSQVMGLKTIHEYNLPGEFVHIGTDLQELTNLLSQDVNKLLERFLNK